MNELRHALRRLRSSPVVTLSAIACLSIGVWMTCIVSAVARGFFRPELGVYDAQQLVQIDEPGLFVTRDGKRVCCYRGRVTASAVVDSLARRKVFAAIGFYSTEGSADVADGQDRALYTVIMSSGMMDVLGVHVALGRRFIPADDSVGAVILSEGTWRTKYGSDPKVIGRRINLWRSTRTVPIVGVMRKDFRFPRDGNRYEAYISPGVGAPLVTPMVQSLARLRDGEDVDDVRPIVREVAFRQIAANRQEIVAWQRLDNPRYHPAALANTPVDIRVDRYYAEPVEGRFISFVLLVIACGLAVVLIAAANVVNLLLVRGASRRQEIAVRMALGAERGQIVRGLVIETGVVSAVGVACGFLVAFWQWQLIDPSFDGRDRLGYIDASTLPAALGAGLALMLIVGVWPGIRATSLSLEQVLRDTRRSGINASPLDTVLGRLVAASTAATVMLLVSAALLGLSARGWVADNIPFEQRGLTSNVTLDDQLSRSRRAEIVIEALRRMRGTAGVQVAAVGGSPVSSPSGPYGVAIDGQELRRLPSAVVLDVSDTWFDALGIRILQGRKLSRADTRDSTNAVVISRSVASALFGAGAAVGRRFRYWSGRDSVVMDAVVAGVSEDVTGSESRQQIFRGFGTLAPARIPMLVTPQLHATLEAAAVTKALRDVPELMSSGVSSPEARPRQAVVPMVHYMTLGFTMFAIVGVVLAAIGTYGIVAYSVARRTHEIGVRMALGAPQSGVAWMIVEQGLRITATGVVFGLMLAYGSTRVLSSYLMDVKSDYPLAMAGVVPLVLCISIVACWIPGARAGRLNPVDALRAE
jgi:putative ABC transport system permease protein